MNRVLIVRLGALGDIVHAIPVAAALRRAAAAGPPWSATSPPLDSWWRPPTGTGDGGTAGAGLRSCTPRAAPSAGGSWTMTAAPRRPVWHVVQLGCAWQLAQLAMRIPASRPCA